jgi:glycosyltransferase involved in cell wall biosynthesis
VPIEKVIFFVPDIKRVSNAPEDYLARLNIYGKHLGQFDEKIGLVLVTSGLSQGGNINFAKKFPFVDIVLIRKTNRNIIKQAISLYTELRKFEPNRALVIPCNPTECFLSTLFVRAFKKFQIQISLHGEVDFGFVRVSAKRKILNMWNLFSIKFANSIRVVSEVEKKYLTEKQRINPRKIIVCPVPIIREYAVMRKISHPKQIAYIGRFHSERNPNDWLEVIESPILKQFNIEVVLAGDGPLKKDFTDRLSRVSNVRYVDYGVLSQNKLLEIWPNIGLLLSTASTEGYGMSIREAILNKTYVLSRRNHGSLILKAEAGRNVIRLFESSNEAAEMVKDYLCGNWKNADFESFTESYQSKLENQLDDLVKSWVIP